MECRRCKQEKKESDFHWKIKAKGIRQTVCHVCVKDQNRDYRIANGKEYNETRSIKYQENVDKIRIGRREKYAENREKFLADNKRWRDENPDKASESAIKSRVKRRSVQLEYNDKYSIKNRDSLNTKARLRFAEKMLDPAFKESERLRSLARNKQEKKDVLDAYGCKCVCCGEKEITFLTIDHIHGNGNNERRSLGIQGGVAFYRFLRKSDYPKGYQVLCFNCNSGKHLNGGICPHNFER